MKINEQITKLKDSRFSVALYIPASMIIYCLGCTKIWVNKKIFYPYFDIFVYLYMAKDYQLCIPEEMYICEYC